MTLDKRTREQLLAYCDQIHEDDCVDPRDYFKTQTRDQRQDHKAQQICRQVRQTLDLVLAGECHDELLQSLRVDDVAPAPDSSRLLVTLCAQVSEDLYDRQAILNLLAGQMGRLRCEVARAITRKRVPTLVFHVVGPNQRHADPSEPREVKE